MMRYFPAAIAGLQITGLKSSDTITVQNITGKTKSKRTKREQHIIEKAG